MDTEEEGGGSKEVGDGGFDDGFFGQVDLIAVLGCPIPYDGE